MSIPTLTDSRRLTGANLYWDKPAAIIDMACEDDPTEFIAEWQAAVDRLLSAVDREEEETTIRPFSDGASLLVSAPVDVLYSMCELNEVAFAMAQAALSGSDSPDFDENVERLRREFEDEANPPLLALQAAIARLK